MLDPKKLHCSMAVEAMQTEQLQASFLHGPYYYHYQVLVLNIANVTYDYYYWINVRVPLNFLGYGIPYIYEKRILFSS